MFDEYVFSADLLDVLNIANNEGHTVAHRLAYDSGELYIKATDDLATGQKFDLLETADNDGRTVLDTLGQKR